MSNQYHPYHVVKPSHWPLLTAISALFFVQGAVLYMHRYSYGLLSMFLGLGRLAGCMGLWWSEVVKEATFEGHHTQAVQKGLRFGVVLFIVSEIMFFFAFFWAFFHSSLAPAVQLGCVWPPTGIVPFDPWGVPLLNTFILLLSGLTITAVHNYMVRGQRSETNQFFVATLVLARAFTLFQLYEYNSAPFSISDGVFGSVFFMATGFHGFHVVIGTLFILVCFLRTQAGHFTREHHVGFEAAAWYWHFVDVVWLFLFVSVYWWGGHR